VLRERWTQYDLLWTLPENLVARRFSKAAFPGVWMQGACL
jgi:hypothetical protein